MKTINKIFSFLFLTLFVLTLSCNKSGDTNATGTGEENITGNSDIGTIVGNPPMPTTTSSRVAFMVSSEEESVSSQLSGGSLCSPLNLNSTIHETQQCRLPVKEYELGILGIYLVECRDANYNDSICAPGTVDGLSITDRITLYDGDQQNIALDLESKAFSATINEITESPQSAIGGIQMVLSYIQQKLPDETFAEEVFNAIASHVRGKTFRVCTTPDDGSEDMLSRCGNAGAQLGDLLVVDDSGKVLFIDVENLTADTLPLTENRPADYEGFINTFMTQTGISASENLYAAYLFSSSDFFAKPGFFAPLIPLETTRLITPGNSYSYEIVLNGSRGFIFNDGYAGLLNDPPFVCVEGLSDGTDCLVGDTDPASSGIYNPFYDLIPSLGLPEGDVQIEEISLAAP